jgi:hypothetical protein
VEREIPLPVRLFAGELSALLLAIAIILAVMWSIVEAELHAKMSALDAMVPVVGLLAILVTRTLPTMSEGRRLAMAGFSASDVIDGMSRVMHERVMRRDELRADPETRRRRTATIWWGTGLLVASVAMIRIALAMRVPLPERQYVTPPAGIALVLTGFALLGTSLVLLLKSPFRMPAGERIFRLLWLGPIGRAFVRLSMRGARPSAASARRPRATPMVSVVRAPSPAPATSAAIDPVASLEARVAELERWRDGLQK